MFTGIVEEVGRVRATSSIANGVRFDIGAARVLDGLALGDSMAVDGVCLTVTALDEGAFSVEAIATTLSRTTLGGLEVGRGVNLERAMALGARLGGHIVQGHVDAVGTVASVRREGEHVLLDVRVPEEVAEVTVLHGSIAVSGVSLTVNRWDGNVAQVALIPYTWEHTNLSSLQAGSPVNLEGDMLGRFVVEYLKRRGTPGVEADGQR